MFETMIKYGSVTSFGCFGGLRLCPANAEVFSCAESQHYCVFISSACDRVLELLWHVLMYIC